MDRRQAAALLGVAADAGRDEVRRAYRRAARGAHPDAGGDHGRFVRLGEARDELLRPPSGPSGARARPDPGRASGGVRFVRRPLWRRLLDAFPMFRRARRDLD